MTPTQAREIVETHLRWACNAPAQWEPRPMPLNVQEALCLLALADDGTREALASEFRDDGPTVITRDG